MLNPLSSMKPGQSAVIRWLDEDRAIAPRLLDLGFAPGTSVTCTLRRNNGEISAFFVRNALIALRQEDSQIILAELLSSQETEENQDILKIREMNASDEDTETENPPKEKIFLADTIILDADQMPEEVKETSETNKPTETNEPAENKEKDSENCSGGDID